MRARLQRLETKLAAYRERLRNYEALADGASCGVFIALTPERHVYANHRAAAITGYSIKELLTRGLVGLAHPDERARLLRNFERRLAGQAVPSPYDTLLVHREGHAIPVELSGALVTWDGQPANMVLIQDLTEIYEAREKHRRVNEALHAVLSIVDELITCRDTDSLLRRSVELARERLGVERCSLHLVDGSLMRGTYGTSLQGTTTDERAHSYAAGDYWAHIRESHPEGSRWLLRNAPYREWTHGTMDTLDASGTTACTAIYADAEALGVFYNDNAISGRPLDPDLQEIIVLYCSLLGHMIRRQRTEEALRASEARFRQMADLLPDMIYEADLKQRLTYVNKAAFDTMGYTREDIARPLRIADLVTPDQVELVQRRFREMDQGAEAVPTQYYLRRADGSLLPVEIRSMPCFGPGGELVGYRGVVRDITERLRVEQAQRMAAVGELAAGIAHDLGNIVTTIKSWAQSARLQGGEEAWQGLADVVLHGCDRGAALCQNLMRLADPPPPERVPINLEAPIEAALAMAAPELRQRQIEVIRRYSMKPRGCVLGDAAQLEQVFLNLIINACHAMPQGGRLTVQTECVPGRGHDGEVLARVTDNGSGIPAELLPRVFEPFVSTHAGPANSDRGTHGLGLSVSYSIVISHGGDLTVQSEVGVGTTFVVRLAHHPGASAAEQATGATS